ncbi:hypothetical protein [Deinococcus alpinitundrae]|uniref:hypothetical protein n=1 Tax=Deinococcus alpinitundrae TaxID=468913 RepID=UPI00137A76CA|nr:hypothetical protein [Deinococcus alpinitundrae]
MQRVTDAAEFVAALDRLIGLLAEHQRTAARQREVHPVCDTQHDDATVSLLEG